MRRLPLDWAATQNNLGNALSTPGQRRMNIRVLCGALEAPERPGAFFSAGTPYYASIVSNSIREDLSILEK